MSLKQIEKNIRQLIMNIKYDYVGYILQSMNIYETSRIPTAGVNYDKVTKRFNLYVNPSFFETLNDTEIEGILIHEIDHILHKHVFRTIEKNDMRRWNIAMDLVINQGNTQVPKYVYMYDKGLKSNTMHIEFFRINGKLLEANKPTDTYYELINHPDLEMLKATRTPEWSKDEPSKTWTKEEIEAIHTLEWVRMNDKDENGKNGWGESDGQSLDEHIFNQDELGKVDEKEAVDAIRDVINNARKRMPEHSRSTEKFKDILGELDKQAKALDFKAIIRTAIKRSLPASNYMRSYQRQNRRLGTKSAGKVVEMLPKLTMLFDTSGSIGTEQINAALNVVDGFLGQVSSVDIHFFHTETYKVLKKVKKGLKIADKDIEYGGTDLTHSFRKLINEGSDLVVVLTDGYFGDIEVDFNKAPKTVFVIDKQGNQNHPWAGKCPTYFYE